MTSDVRTIAVTTKQAIVRASTKGDSSTPIAHVKVVSMATNVRKNVNIVITVTVTKLWECVRQSVYLVTMETSVTNVALTTVTRVTVKVANVLLQKVDEFIRK